MDDLEERKSQHLTIVTAGRGLQGTRDAGFNAVRFVHNALPELAYDSIDKGTTFLGRNLSAPLMVSARPAARWGWRLRWDCSG